MVPLLLYSAHALHVTPSNYVSPWIPQMAKNKGLTPKRKKIDRNPRVKHREKFRRAKIRRKGQVCTPCIDENVLITPSCIIKLSETVWTKSIRQCQTQSQDRLLRPLFVFTRSVRFVGRRRDIPERCLAFVLVSRRASNLSNQERIQHMLPSVTMGLKYTNGLLMFITCDPYSKDYHQIIQFSLL